MRMRRDLIFILTVAAISASGRAQEIQRLDPSLDQLVAPNARLERIADGFNKWTEGPVWTNQGTLLFAEIPANNIDEWVPGQGAHVFMHRSGYEGSTPFKGPEPGFDPRGIDIDSHGVVWTALAASSHLASFDVRKCKDLDGPARTDGSQCREGWTLYQTTGPKLRGTDVPADFHYYNWVDQHDISGFGADTPFATGSNSDALLALNPQRREWTTLRVPYPLGFYSRGMDGRIDDPSAGWKGRALYANYGTHFVWHIEGGKGTRGKIVKFQIRPNPLAR